MWRPLFISLFLISALGGCATTRKVSQVGLREPAAAREAGRISSLRRAIMTSRSLPKTCPESLRSSFPRLAGELISFPGCPENFENTYRRALIYLKPEEEQSVLEAVLNSQCRSLGLGDYGESLVQLLNNFDTSGPLGRRAILRETLRSTEDETRLLTDLRQSLEEIVNQNLPLERWARRRGPFVLPEEDLNSLNRLIAERSCRLDQGEVDEVFRSLRGLEELVKILPEGEQRTRLEAFFEGVNAVIARRLDDFFKP